jgi:membrane protein YqaA with SNARE-associated domain
MTAAMTTTAYLTLFLSAFGAATILPGSSEVVLSALLVQHRDAVGTLLVVATVGNTLGAIVNWLLGRFLVKWQGRTWFPVAAPALERASALFGRFGYPLLLLSWLPVIGDPITLAAGVLRARLLPFILLVLVGKAARYAVVAGAVAGGLSLGT